MSYHAPGYTSKVEQSNGIGTGRVTGNGAMRGKVESMRKGQSHASASSKTTGHIVKKSRRAGAEETTQSAKYLSHSVREQVQSSREK